MADLLEIVELQRKGVGAETILRIIGPLMEQRKLSILARLSKANGLPDFLEIQAESRVVLSVLSQLQGLVDTARSFDNTAGAAH